MIISPPFLLLALLILALPLSGAPHGHAVDVDRGHDFHVSYGRLAVEGSTAVIRVRFFQEDLMKAVQKQQDAYFELTTTPRADSIALAYMGRRLRIAAAAESLKAVVRASGEDLSGQEPMWWYLLEFAASTPIEDLEITNTLLFETFDDQKNIVQMQHFPSEKTWSFYFTPDSDRFGVAMP